MKIDMDRMYLLTPKCGRITHMSIEQSLLDLENLCLIYFFTVWARGSCCVWLGLCYGSQRS